MLPADVDLDLLQIVRAEYLEMPGLSLTPCQAQRLWDLDPETCTCVLSELLERKFLARTERGTYVRATGMTRF